MGLRKIKMIQKASRGFKKTHRYPDIPMRDEFEEMPKAFMDMKAHWGESRIKGY